MSARILVVDDSPSILHIAADVLGDAGYLTDTVRALPDALFLARQEPPHLMLLDAELLETDGYRFWRAMCDEPALSAVPVVLMTGPGDVARDRFARAVGVTDWITKPFSPEALLAVSSYTLEKQQRRQLPTPEAASTALAAAAPESGQAGLFEALASALAMQLVNRGVEHAAAIARTAAEEAVRRAPPDASPGRAPGLALWCDLSHMSLPEVIQLLQMQYHTGLFQVWHHNTRYDIYLRKGRVIAARAENAAQEYLLGRFLVARGLIGQSELEQLVRSSSGRGSLPIGEKLIRLGHIRAEDLRRALADQCNELVYEALRSRNGCCVFVASVTPPPVFDGLLVDMSIQELLLEGLRRVDEWGVIEREVHSFDTVFAPRPAEAGGFTHDEQRLLQLVDGRRSVRELVTLARMRPFEACRLLYRLAATRKIVRVESEPAAGPPPPGDNGPASH
ncbi:MAG: response regulator [Deltaproteobacteria bacterium]|nr:response regulator [Deltaproteobacteria bacterium]